VNFVQSARSWVKTRKISLPWMLIVPFILQVVPVVTYVGYLSYQNGQRSVADLTEQLMGTTSRRIEDKLNSYLAAPPLANQILRDAVHRGDLKLDLDHIDPARDRYLLQQMRLFKQLTWISIGTETGDSIGIWRPGDNDQLQIAMTNPATQYFGHYYATNEQNQRTKRLQIEKPAFDPRTRPWYKAAFQTQKPLWNPVYAGFTPGTIFVSASQPLFDPTGKLVGVSGIDILLTDIQAFLRQNRVSPGGQVFLMERSGNLIASSTPESSFRWAKDKKPEQIRAIDSQMPLIHDTATQLQQQVGDFQRIQQPQQFQFTIHRTNHFVRVVPFHLTDGPEWLIVMVVPEVDVMGNIYSSTQTMVLLCMAASIMIIALNTIISRWLVKPIVSLSRASQQIAQGDFQLKLRSPRVKELFTLAASFMQMSEEIQQSRQQLEDYSRSLEDKVIDRTAALEAEVDRRAQAEAALTLANQELHNFAYIDGLTQIANRRRFDEQLAAHWQRLQREQLPLSLILCDVDYFKCYNDCYGHQAGDDCLTQVAAAIATGITRPADVAARYGGEEFAILLPNTHSAGAIVVADRIRQQLAQLALPHAQSAISDRVTISLGIATIVPVECLTLGELIATADRALYQAKTNGRNQAAIAQWAAPIPVIAQPATSGRSREESQNAPPRP
jgi:diguanylate cyclase (GGDEF)-like protein